jgi:hypothetical protein
MHRQTNDEARWIAGKVPECCPSLKTAKEMGLTVLESSLARADMVIE